MADQIPAHWLAAEEACRAWTKTRQMPHPPLPEVVRYVVKAGTPAWVADRMAKVSRDIAQETRPCAC